jgi:putative transposase
MFGVGQMCRVLQVSRSGYDAWARRGMSRRQQEDRQLSQRIQIAFAAGDRTYGALRLRTELQAEGVRVGKNRIRRLMRHAGLQVATQRRYRVTTNSSHRRPVAPNLLQREFRAPAVNRVWTGDLTCIRTNEGWLYLAVVLDVFSRRIVGWSMQRRMADDLVIAAFRHAVTHRKPASGLVFHSDRGSQ